MPDLVPVLIGTAGVVDGECYLLGTGSEVVLGRSRACDISLRRVANYLKLPAATRDADHDFNTVSRRHLRISVSDGKAALSDLSTNGTFCNGEQLKGTRTVDLANGACAIRLGTRECFDLIMLPLDDERVRRLKPVQPNPAAASADDRD